MANEVETEQIVHDASLSSLGKSHFTSYVQLRGSVPAFWSQDPKQVPKPPIVSKLMTKQRWVTDPVMLFFSYLIVDMNDPTYVVASQHFRQLLYRYGAPSKFKTSAIMLSTSYLCSSSCTEPRESKFDFCLNVYRKMSLLET